MDLSGLVWAAEIPLDLLGTRFVVQTTHAGLAEQLAALLEPFLAGARPVRGANRISLVEARLLDDRVERGKVVALRDCRRLGAPQAAGGAAALAMAALNRSAIEHYGGFALHAGVAARHGAAVAFPAASGGGKSTLTAACLQAGMDYVSDEALCVEPDPLRLVPYPRPLSLDRRSRRLLGLDDEALRLPPGSAEGLVAPKELGADVAVGPIALRNLVLAGFGEDEPGLVRVPAHEGMAELIRASFNHYKLGEAAFRTAAALANQVEVWRLRYRTPPEGAEAIASLFD